MTTTGTWVIYLITNRVNGHRYVGVTRRPVERFREHLVRVKSGCLLVSRAVRKYGVAAFQFDILKQCGSLEEAARFEIEMIASIKPEYNIAEGGITPSYWTGKKRSAETKAKIAATKRASPTPSKCIESVRAFQTQGQEKSAELRRQSVTCLADGMIFASAKEAGAFYHLPPRSINQVASGRRKGVYGLRFRYGDLDA